MLAYQFTLPLAKAVMSESSPEARRGRGDALTEVLERMNKELGKGRADEDFCLFAFRQNTEGLMMIAMSRSTELCPGDVRHVLREFCYKEKIHGWKCQAADFHEITMSSFFSAMSCGEERDFINIGYRFYKELGLGDAKEYLSPNSDRDSCQITETVATMELPTKSLALKRARLLLGPRSLMEEVERIYCRKNRRVSTSHPVHYFIHAHSRRAAQMMIELLVAALGRNGRLTGKRITYLSDFEPSNSTERALREILKPAGHSTVSLELSNEAGSVLHSNFGNRDEGFKRLLKDQILKIREDTLFFFVEIGGHHDQENIAFLRDIAEEMDIVSIREGSGDEKGTRLFLNESARLDGQSPFSPGELESAVPEGRYTLTEADAIFRRLSKERTRRDAFPSYQNLRPFSEMEKEAAEKKKSASERLERMVGLGEVKRLVRQIVAANQMRKLKKEMKMKSSSQAMHMAFTGNPGSAKTTVARLLAAILKEEGVSATGAFVECGRSDLVAKYVGWTAKAVKQKFKDASGGVLFIDEAYSLVDGSNSFGAEAINTIVQEMENRRDDVLVVFAGYPDKMREFLDSNEGFNSRVAFHLDFPDYTADEMVEILQVMAKERGLRLNAAILEKCRGIFADASAQEDFGNGRYVRNVLEAAVIRQAERLMAKQEKRPVTRQMAASLHAEDFEPVKVGRKKGKRDKAVGFCFASEEDSEV